MLRLALRSDCNSADQQIFLFVHLFHATPLWCHSTFLADLKDRTPYDITVTPLFGDKTGHGAQALHICSRVGGTSFIYLIFFFFGTYFVMFCLISCRQCDLSRTRICWDHRHWVWGQTCPRQVDCEATASVQWRCRQLQCRLLFTEPHAPQWVQHRLILMWNFNKKGTWNFLPCFLFFFLS